MIYSLSGKITEKENNAFVLEIGGGVFLKIKSPLNVLKSLPQTGEVVKVYTHLYVREDVLELYGFLDKEELEMFEMLIAVSGIGPRSAMGILGVETIEKLKAAISEGRVELLTKASGIGKKTAERIVLELRGKMKLAGSGRIVGIMESDQDIIEALSNLGYTKTQAKDALSRVGPDIVKMEDRIKEALRVLKNNLTHN